MSRRGGHKRKLAVKKPAKKQSRLDELSLASLLTRIGDSDGCSLGQARELLQRRVGDNAEHDIAAQEKAADCMAESAEALEASRPAVAYTLYIKSLEVYHGCFKRTGDSERRLSFAESYLTTYEGCINLLLKNHPKVVVDAASLRVQLQLAFTLYDTLLVSRDRADLPERYNANYYEAFERDWLTLCYNMAHMAVLTPGKLSADFVVTVIRPYLEKLQSYQANRIDQPVIAAGAERRFSDLVTPSAVSARATELPLALPTISMMRAPGHHFAEGLTAQVQGDSAVRLDWMHIGVKAGLTTAKGSAQQVPTAAITAAQLLQRLRHVYTADECEYLKSVCALSGRIGLAIALDRQGDTFINASSYQAVLDCVANGMALTHAVLAMPAEKASALAVQRPPSHHAGACGLKVSAITDTEGAGFCVMNVMLAEVVAQAKQGRQVLIVDIDVHSGNGTQQLLINTIRRLAASAAESDQAMSRQLRANVRFLNYFEASNYPFVEKPYADGEDCQLAQEFEDVVINVPYDNGMLGNKVAVMIQQQVDTLKASGFTPTLTYCSYGMDAHVLDRISHAKFRAQDYRNILMSLPGKLVVLPEGGYNKRGITEAMKAAAQICVRRTQLRPLAHLLVAQRQSLSGGGGKAMAGGAAAAVKAEELASSDAAVLRR